MIQTFPISPRARVILSNDFGGDPDGLVQLAHHLLSPSIEIRGIIGSFFAHGSFFDYDPCADQACVLVDELLSVMGLDGKYPVYKGADAPLNMSAVSDGARFIVQEAMRDDTDLPLFVLCGASLTDIASACLIEPAIVEKIILVWIGGPEYSETARLHSGCPALEYNMGIDIKAAQFIFNESKVPFWQVPRDVYRQVLMSYAELCFRVKPRGNTGEYLADKVEQVIQLAGNTSNHSGEAYVMGDSPLVLLSALQSVFDPDASSSSFIVRNAPRINNDGLYGDTETERKIRVYVSMDGRFLLEDFYAKLALFE